MELDKLQLMSDEEARELNRRFPRAIPPTNYGFVRFIFRQDVVEPTDRSWDYGVEIYRQDTFEIGFISENDREGPIDMLDNMLADLESKEQLAGLKLAPGVYEIVGEFWYEFDPGESTPNGPAEADAWWDLREPKVRQLTDQQAAWFEPPPTPPPAQEWEHSTQNVKSGRYNYECPGCHRWAHRCGQCSYMDFPEESYCSEKCWLTAGSPTVFPGESKIGG